MSEKPKRKPLWEISLSNQLKLKKSMLMRRRRSRKAKLRGSREIHSLETGIHLHRSRKRRRHNQKGLKTRPERELSLG